jgi:replication initiation protein RepC
VDTILVPRGAASGLRKLTLNHLAAARLAEQPRGLPDGLRHPNQLLGTLRRAAPYTGHARLLPLLEALFRWTQPQDWEPQSDPVVWPSNEVLALALDCSERHVSRLLAAAIEARLIAPRDGSDRKRRGWREHGRIVWAWGFSLRPMAARHAEFRAAAEAGEAARRDIQAARREARRLLQSLAQLQELAGTPLAAPAMEEALALGATLKRAETPEAIAGLLQRLRGIEAAARARLETAGPDADMSGSPDSGVSALIPTSTPTEPEGSTVAPPLPGCAAAASGSSAAKSDSPGEEALELVLSAPELVRLAPRLAPWLGRERPDWGQVGEAACRLAEQLGIPPGLYGEACRRLGRRPAAVAVAVISTRPPGHFHTSGPGGYLRGMLLRAERGELRLDRSLHGLREGARRQVPG